ncbi:hypothetical protein [Deefgea salmonis]|uniref:Oxidoreductase molybdopterin-binding domain-containing protein n=1 Tax=Deefgea salmonis TaxID=2875502 RepID=A0ABS8BJF5_9NEIS|nr:hypothetical protein [Deefgea salmonis]MCB5195852.1 hypothetical protein [Deefgea salmonis]
MIRALLLASLFFSPIGHAVTIEPPQGPAVLTMSGHIGQYNQGNTLVFDDALLNQLPQKNIRTSSPWYSGIHTFTGPLLSDVLKRAVSKGQQLHLKAMNDYTIVIPSSDTQFEPILARKIDGKAFSTRDKGPLFLMFPFDQYTHLQNRTYFSRAVWQLIAIKVE